MANPFPFSVGAVLTAAQMNSIGEAWTSYTPTIRQGVNVTKTIQECRYTQVNKLVFVKAHFQLTSAGTAGSVIEVSVPPGLAPFNVAGIFAPSCGAAGAYKTAGALQYNMTTQANSAYFTFYATSVGGSYFGQFPAFTIANGDYLFFYACYEVA